MILLRTVHCRCHGLGTYSGRGGQRKVWFAVFKNMMNRGSWCRRLIAVGSCSFFDCRSNIQARRMVAGRAGKCSVLR